MAFGHFCLGSHNFMVTALGSCVKWHLAMNGLLFEGYIWMDWPHLYGGSQIRKQTHCNC